MGASSINVPRVVFLLPRVYLGLIFAVAVYAKYTAPHGFAAALTGFLSGVALQNGFLWYRPIVSDAVLPNVQTFAVAIMAAETVVALAMFLGLWTRVASVVAIFLLLNYASAKGLPFWSPASNDAADIVLAVLVFMGNAGLAFGLDGLLRSRKRG